MSWMPVLSTRHAGWVDTRASKTRQARFALVDVVATIDIESRLAPGMATAAGKLETKGGYVDDEPVGVAMWRGVER